MGLDMYLTKKTFVGAEYEHRKITGEIKVMQDGKPMPIEFKRVSNIEENVGYWRKANQIHRWFVENVQEGKDDCGEYSVSKKQMIELLTICKQVEEVAKLKDGAITNGYVFEGGVKMPIVEEGKEITNPKKVASLLPTASGFFFGSTDYDEYYMQDIDNTIEIVETILQEEGESEKDYFNADYYYHSSW